MNITSLLDCPCNISKFSPIDIAITLTLYSVPGIISYISKVTDVVVRLTSLGGDGNILTS